MLVDVENLTWKALATIARDANSPEILEEIACTGVCLILENPKVTQKAISNLSEVIISGFVNGGKPENAVGNYLDDFTTKDYIKALKWIASHSMCPDEVMQNIAIHCYSSEDVLYTVVGRAKSLDITVLLYANSNVNKNWKVREIYLNPALPSDFIESLFRWNPHYNMFINPSLKKEVIMDWFASGKSGLGDEYNFKKAVELTLDRDDIDSEDVEVIIQNLSDFNSLSDNILYTIASSSKSNEKILYIIYDLVKGDDIDIIRAIFRNKNCSYNLSCEIINDGFMSP